MYTLSNEIKTLSIIIDHKWHITMCIMAPKQYNYNVRYKYLGPGRRQSSRLITWHMISRTVQNRNMSFFHYILYLRAHNLDTIAHVNKREGHQYSWFVLLLHTKDVYRDRICMVVSYGQRWIIFTNVNHLYKKNTHLIPKN
jgi:hypothetical protein